MDKRLSASEWIRVTGSILSRRSEFFKANVVLAFIALIFFAKPILLGLVPSASDILTIWPIFDLGHTLVQNQLLSDVVVQSEPWIFFNSLNLQNFQLPLWNPYCAGGVPHFANMFFSVFFFPAWPIYIIGVSKYTLLFLYFCKIYLAGICCYCYLRSIGIKPYPAIIGSTAYMFIGFNVVWLYYPPSNLIFILPAMLYLIEKVTTSRSNEKYFLALTILTTTGIIAGFPVMFFHIAVVSLMYLVYKLLSKNPLDAAWVLKRYIFFSALGVALSAIQLMPFLEYLLNSNAWVVMQGTGTLDWHAAILNLQPEFYGSSSIYQMVPYYVHFTNYNESASGYVGIAMVCLAVFAVITKFKDGLVRFYLILSIWAIGVIYGLPGIFDLTVSLPLFSKANNIRLLFMIGFTVIVLGALGLNKIIDEPEYKDGGRTMRYFSISATLVLAGLFVLAWANRNFIYTSSTLSLANFYRVVLAQNILVLCTTIVVVIVYILIYIFIKYNHNCRYRTISLVLFFFLVFAETGSHGMLFEPAVDERYFHPKVDAFDWINSQDELYRTTSISSIGSISVYPVNTQMTYKIYDIRNYDVLENKYYWKLFNTFCSGMMRGWINLERVDERFLNFMGVKWVLSDSDLRKINGIAIKDCTNPVGELVKGFAVEQEFTSSRANLSAIDIFFATHGKEGLDSNLTIKLISKRTGTVLRAASINSMALKDNQWYNWEFSPLNDSANEKYVFSIDGDGRPGRSATIWMNSKKPDNLTGGLYINGLATIGSLCFGTYYDLNTAFHLIKKYPAYNLFENRDVLPRAFVVQKAVYGSNDSEIMISLENQSFDWRSSVILWGNEESVQFPTGKAEARITDYQPTYVKIAANTSQPGFLVLSDAYYPGWTAYLNGAKVPILRANYAFRAVKISDGNNTIEFKYEPLSLYLGSAITLIALFILIFFSMRRGK